MKKLVATILCFLIIEPLVLANNNTLSSKIDLIRNKYQIKHLLNSQAYYANRGNFTKFINTYDKEYNNSDGFDLKTFSEIVQDVWSVYQDIDYGIKIKDISINNDTAKVTLDESSFAKIPKENDMSGILKGVSDSIYYLKKVNGKWKVYSDEVISESTSLLYGNAQDVDIKLSAPNTITPNTEYTASLELVPPSDDIMAFASIVANRVEYPQSQSKDVFRKVPEDYLLERLFTSNDRNKNEYIVASFGLAKADIEEENIKIKFTGCGYKIIRVNVLQDKDVTKDDKLE